jgi:hypothetical protein
MAERPIAFWRAIALLALLVALVHWAGLLWLTRELQSASMLRPMATPLFTRVLTPAVPRPPPQKPKPVVARVAQPPVSPESPTGSNPVAPAAAQPTASASAVPLEPPVAVTPVAPPVEAQKPESPASAAA